MGKAVHITEDYRTVLKQMIMNDLPKDALLAVLEVIPPCPCDPSLGLATEPKPVSPSGKKGAGKRRAPIRILRPGDKARYLENGKVVHEAKTPNALTFYTPR